MQQSLKYRNHKKMTNTLQQIEWTSLNLVSLGWILADILDWMPTVVTIFVGLSIVFLNVARGINALRGGKKKKDGEK